ncbi:MAG: hypothetical protein D6709_01580 [Chloroflexi bacterium]|nr:MAG: hypothetical protein D6709_01580 [Chloroflexota bacterium]
MKLLWVGAGLAAALGLGVQTARAQQCFATIDGTTVYSSPDAQAVRDAVGAAAPGDVVKVAGVCAGVSGAQVVAIGQPLTLRGGYTLTNWALSDPNAHPTVLDAQQAGRVVYATQPLTLENLIVRGGRWTNPFESGGGVALESAGVISNVVIRGSEAANGAGGGLYVGGPATVTHSALVSNVARYRGGGASFNAEVWIVASAFLSNTVTDFSAGYGGGANFGFSAPATVSSSTFAGNAAGAQAGGARFDNRATLRHVTFTHNIARGIGGAIFSNETHAQDVTFAHNQATVLSTGGAHFNWVTWLTDTTFYSNSAAMHGGGAYFNQSFFGDLAALRNVSFVSNTADERGGGAFAFNQARLEGQGVTFVGNRAQQEGGGLYVSGAADLSEAQFSGNTAGASGGGAFFAQPVTLSVAAFMSNTAQGMGGGALFAANLLAQGPLTFTANAAGVAGGGAHVSATLALSGSAWIGNSAGRGGGLSVAGPVTLSAVTFVGNQAMGAQGFGGGVYAGGVAGLSEAQFLSNTARQGGGMYALGATALEGVTFTANVALANGGGALLLGAAAISGSAFAGNRALGGSGPIWAGASGRGEAFAPLALLALNGSGGGAALFGATIITRSAFIGNSAAEHGGGAYGWGAVGGSGVIWRDNAAARCGGGLHLAGMTVGGRARWVNSLWAGNAAGQGAAVCAAHDGGDDALILLHATLVSPMLVGAEAVRVNAGAVYLTNTLIASHTVGVARLGGAAQVAHVLIGGASAPLSGTVMLAGPLFIGPARFVDVVDYALAPVSLAIDGGAPEGVSADYFGRLRPQGNAPDIGYAESEIVLRRVFAPRAVR